MGQQVCKSLTTNWIGAVNGGDFTTVPDYSDLAVKADKSYVQAVEKAVNQNIASESSQRAGGDQQLQKQVQEVAASVGSKADKQALKDILSEASLGRVKTTIETLFAQHLESIQRLCTKERIALEKDIASFNTLAAGANKELAAKLQPMHEQLKNVLSRIDNIAAGAGSLKQVKADMDALTVKLSETQRRAAEAVALIDQKKDSLNGYVLQQVQLAEKRIVATLVSQFKQEKKKGFFARLFS